MSYLLLICFLVDSSLTWIAVQFLVDKTGGVCEASSRNGRTTEIGFINQFGSKPFNMLVFSVFYLLRIVSVVSFFPSFDVPIANCNSPIIDFWHIPKINWTKHQRPVLWNSFCEVAYLGSACKFCIKRAFVHVSLMRRSWFLYARWLSSLCHLISFGFVHELPTNFMFRNTQSVPPFAPILFSFIRSAIRFLCQAFSCWTTHIYMHYINSKLTILYELHFVNFHYDWSLRLVHSTVKYVIIYRFNRTNCSVAKHKHTGKY